MDKEILKYKDIIKLLDDLIITIPWETTKEVIELKNVMISIYFDVVIPDNLALMIKLSEQEPDECKKMRKDVHNKLCKLMDVYSDSYKSFLICTTLMDKDKNFEFKEQTQFYDRLKEEIKKYDKRGDYRNV